mmetsp:Transcript_14848/g.30783  ORF Transcript_14848/g.30783 Transcript_14848/m.30783 type:complete len:93 (+) Transcript_14848:104-382(+)
MHESSQSKNFSINVLLGKRFELIFENKKGLWYLVSAVARKINGTGERTLAMTKSSTIDNCCSSTPFERNPSVEWAARSLPRMPRLPYSGLPL